MTQGTREIKYERPWLASYQEEHIFCAERYSWIEATVKSGKTMGCLAWLVEEAVIERPGVNHNFWWVAPVIAQARIVYRRAKHYLPQGMFQANDTQMELVLPTGEVLRFLGSDDPDNLYGEDVYGAVVDEAPRCREEAFNAVRSTLTATRGRIRIIGNVKGRRNWAWRGCRRAEEGLAGHHYGKITAYDAVQAGIIPHEEVEDAQRVLPPEVFAELYLAQASDEGGSPFGYSAIGECTVGGLSEAEPVVWGWDLAKSEDWTVGIALDREMRVCRFLRFQRPWLETVMAIRQEVGQAPALVDSTGVGDPIVEALARGGMRVEGFKFSERSRQQLLEGLALVIQERKVRFPAGPLVVELESFGYEYRSRDGRFTGVRYSVPEGLHDDCAMALALAVRHAEDVRFRGRFGPRLALPAGQSVALAPPAFGNPREGGSLMVRRSRRLTHAL